MKFTRVRIVAIFAICMFINDGQVRAQDRATISIGRGVNKQHTELQSIQIENEILGDVLVQKYVLSFYNAGHGMAEGELVCPLPKGARIVEYAMDVFGEKRDGVVVSAEKAVYAYEDIVRQRTDPGLVEIDEENNLFRMRVFPIEAEKEKKVWLTTMRIIEGGKVDLGLEILGAAMTCETRIKVSNVSEAPVADGWKFTEAEKGIWTATMEGEKQALKPCMIAVKSLPLKLEWKEKGKIYGTVISEDNSLLGIYPPRKRGGVYPLWWDGSVKANFKILENLEAWMIWKQQCEIELMIFRSELSDSEKFTVENGKCDALMERLQKIEPYGMARPSILPWNADYDGAIIVSDGKFAEGYKGIPDELNYPLYAVLEESGDSYLKDISRSSQEVGVKFFDPSSASSGKIGSSLIHSGIMGSQTADRVQHKAAYWLWAYHYAKKLRAKAESSFEISNFHTEHQVADGKYSWIVLENIHQHIQYNIPPPETSHQLMAGWRQHLIDKKVKLNQRLLEYSVQWDQRCGELMKEKPLFKEYTSSLIRDDVMYWKSIPEELFKISANEKQVLNSILTKVNKATSGKSVYDQMKEYIAFRKKLLTKQRMMYVTITGQVGKPGPTLMQFGTSIKQALDIAKPTVFGAQNRVELLRNNKVYKYNMKIPAHASVKLFPRDVLTVREKRWLGNGGRVDNEPVPFEKNRKSDSRKVTLKKSAFKWDKKKTYLQTLSKVSIDDTEKWYKKYLTLRKEFGWRADFYEDIICFLLDKKSKKLTSRVAQDLAELHPDNTEILRRAGRAFLRGGELEIAKRIFQRIAFLTDNGETSLYDLARVFEREKNYRAASVLYYEAIKCDRSSQAESRYIVY